MVYVSDDGNNVILLSDSRVYNETCLTSAQVRQFSLYTSVSDNNNIVILVFNIIYYVFQSTISNFIVTTSDDNGFIVTTSDDNGFIVITSGDNE